MKISEMEYQRGIVWLDHSDILVNVASTNTPGDPDSWSEGIVTRSGEIAPVPPGIRRAMRVLPKQLNSPYPKGWTVRWEFSVGSHVETLVLDNVDDGGEATLSFVPDFGTYHRLVVSTPLLAGSEEFALRYDNVVVRSVEGGILGQHPGTIDPATISAWEAPKFEDARGGDAREGRFIEIVAPGSTSEDAELASFAILGFLATCLGDPVVGEVVFSEHYQLDWDGATIGLPVPLRNRTPTAPSQFSTDALANGFEAVTASVAIGGGSALGLRWYEQGILVEAPLDKLLSFFVGVEAVIRSFATDHGPLPLAEARKAERAAVKQLLALQHNQATAKRVRDKALHGEKVRVEQRQASDTRRLLGSILRAEFGIEALVRWEPGPRVLDARVTHRLKFPGPFILDGEKQEGSSLS